MNDYQKRQCLEELLLKTEPEEIPTLMSDRAVRYFMKLPNHTDIAWTANFDRNPQYVAKLWFAAVVQHLYNNKDSQYEPDITVNLWVENKDFLRKIQPFITEEILNTLSPWSHVMTHFKALFNPVGKYSKALHMLWFGRAEEHSEAFRLMASITFDESFSESHAVKCMLQTTISQNWPVQFSSWEEKLGCAMPFFTWGLSGTAPPVDLCTEAFKWHALGYFTHCEQPLDLDYAKTANRLDALKEENVELRLVILEKIVASAPALEEIFPYESSVLYRWARINGVSTRPTMYDAARALIPEHSVDWTNMESLGMPIAEAFIQIKGQAKFSKTNNEILPEDIVIL